MPKLSLSLEDIETEALAEILEWLLTATGLIAEGHSGRSPRQRSTLASRKSNANPTQEDESLGPRLRKAIVEVLREGPKTNSQIREQLGQRLPQGRPKSQQINWQLKQLRKYGEVRLVQGRKWELVRSAGSAPARSRLTEMGSAGSTG